MNTSESNTLNQYLEKLIRIFLVDESQKSVAVPWWLRLIFAVTGGTCVFLAFPEFNQFYLAYFALALELWAIEGLSPKKAFFVGWLAGTITNCGGFYWIGSLLEDFGHMPELVAYSLSAGLGIVQGLVFALWAYFIRKINAKSIWYSGAAAFIGIEMFFPLLFPWYYANSQYNFVPAVQTADIFGVLGVSFMLVLCNILIYDVTRTLWMRRTDKTQAFHKKGIVFAIAYIAFCFIYAPVRMAQIDAVEAESPHLNVGMVEADVGIWENEPAEKLRNNLFIHHTLSHELSLQGVDLIVWPESSYQQGVIWGSRKVTDSPMEHEIDALFADWFQPKAHLIFAAIDRSFGENFHRNPVIHTAMMRSIMTSANDNGWKTLEPYYPGLVSGFPVMCSNKPSENEEEDGQKQIMKCPFNRLVPDDLTYYLTSTEPLRDSRKSDLLKLIRPEDIGAPVRDFNAALLFGTLSVAKVNDDDEVGFDELYRLGTDRRKLFNTAHLVEKDGRVLGTYHKNYLLMFGEYIPYADKFPWVYKLLPEAGNITPGDSFDTMHFRGYELGPIICYEDILPRYVRKISALRPNVFVNVTNDAWFGKTSEPMLHLALAMMRTVEHRKWLIRSTNTGVSAFVDPNGRMVQHTSIYEPEILRQSVAMMPRTRTVYSYIGDILGWICGIFCAFLLVLRCRKNALENASKTETDAASSQDEAEKEISDDAKKK